MENRMAIFFGALMLAFSSLTSAAYFVDTGAGSTYTWGGNGLYVDQQATGKIALAGRFSIDHSYAVTDIEGWIGTTLTTSSSGSVAIYLDANGTPGTEIFSTSFSFQGTPYVEDLGFKTDWRGANGLTFALNAGTYWVSFEARPGDTLDAWMAGSSPNAMDGYAATSSGNPWSVLGYQPKWGMRINATEGTTVPEPESIALVGIALLGIFVSRRKRI